MYSIYRSRSSSESYVCSMAIRKYKVRRSTFRPLVEGFVTKGWKFPTQAFPCVCVCVCVCVCMYIPICWRTLGSIILAICWLSLAICDGLTFLVMSPPVRACLRACVCVCLGVGDTGTLQEYGHFTGLTIEHHIFLSVNTRGMLWPFS